MASTTEAAKESCRLKKLERGEYNCKQSEDGRMIATVWKDSSLVFNLTTCHNVAQEKVSQKIWGPQVWETVNLKSTEGNIAYDKYMGGVNRHDHLWASYTIQRPGHQWWCYFVWFLIDVSLVNSYILFKMVNVGNTSHKQFRLKVARQLVGGFSMRSCRTRHQDVVDLDKALAQDHSRTVIFCRPRACKLCIKRKIKTCKGRAKETRDGCRQWQVYLHKDCFWH